MANPFSGFAKLPTWEKAAIVLGGAGVVWFVYKQHEDSQAAAASSAAADTTTATTTATEIDPATGLPYSQDNEVDPVTGMTYAEEAAQYGSVSAAEAAVEGGYGTTGALDAYDESGLGYGDSYSGDYGYDTGTDTGSAVSYPDNASWAQAAQAGLSGLGWSSETVAGALGAYLGRLPLSSSQAAIVQAAIAEYGPPPVGTYNIISSSSGGGGTTTGTSTDVTVPDVAGVDVEQATSILRDAGLKASGPAGATGVMHVVTSTSPASGAKVTSGTTVKLNYKTETEGSGTKTGSSDVTVPNVIGQPQEAAYAIISEAGLKPSGSATIKGKTIYVVSQSPKSGTKASKGTTVHLTSKQK